MKRSEQKDLLVLSDDWGRHPSSCQHLIRELLPRYQVTWMNTIGTRQPGLDAYSVLRGLGKATRWIRKKGSANRGAPVNPNILEPLMWPSFRSRFGRSVNKRLLVRAVRQALPDLRDAFALTTLPIAADLVQGLPEARWVYYCVDDLSAWPGLDRPTLQSMERLLLQRVDAVVAVSEHLVKRIAALGRQATLLTHGVNLDYWRASDGEVPRGLAELPPPRVVFWGVVDRRLDSSWLTELSERREVGSIVLIGPANNPDPAPLALPNLYTTGAMPFDSLPAIAASAAVLIMPYADLPVTRAMQPLKLKEYLATGRPVVARKLPAVEPWSDACDAVASAHEFADRVVARLHGERSELQEAARERLVMETWENKALTLEEVLRGESALEVAG